MYRSPSLAGDDTHFLTVPMRGHAPGLPPLIIRGIDDVEDVPVPEAETLAGEAAVLWLLIVKQCPVQQKVSGVQRLLLQMRSIPSSPLPLFHVIEKLRDRESWGTALPGQRE